MTCKRSCDGPTWTPASLNADFGEAVRRTRVDPTSHFPVTLVELHGTGSRQDIRLISNPDLLRHRSAPPAGSFARRSWFPDAGVWEVSRVAILLAPSAPRIEASAGIDCKDASVVWTA